MEDFIGGLQFRRVSPWSLKQGAWQQARSGQAVGRQQVRTVTGNLHLCPKAGSRESKPGMAWNFETSEPTPSVTYLLSQDHTS